jgi:hypothetical protein
MAPTGAPIRAVARRRTALIASGRRGHRRAAFGARSRLQLARRDPLSLLCRLVALVPAPRFHTRCPSENLGSGWPPRPASRTPTMFTSGRARRRARTTSLLKSSSAAKRIIARGASRQQARPDATSPSYCVAFRLVSRCASSRTAPTQATETAGVFVDVRGLRAGAPGKNRTCDLGFRKAERARSVVIPYDSRTVRFSSGPLLLRDVVARSRFHAITIDALDRAPQVVRVEVGVTLRGGEVGVAGQLLDGDG